MHDSKFHVQICTSNLPWSLLVTVYLVPELIEGRFFVLNVSEGLEECCLTGGIWYLDITEHSPCFEGRPNLMQG
jgi:hypothetical protein